MATVTDTATDTVAAYAPSSPTPRSTQVAPTPSKIPTATPQLVKKNCRLESGRIETGSIESELIRTPVEFQIYLPGCYDHQPGVEFPVLYLFHGQGFTDQQWLRIGVAETADRLIAEKMVAPFVVVMPHDRLSDEETMNLFGEVFMNEFMPALEDKYRVTPDRKYRAIGGLSRGAGWAVHLGIANWQLFSKIGAHSPAILNSDPIKLGATLDDIPPDFYPDFFIDAGDRDRPEILESNGWLGELLKPLSPRGNICMRNRV